MTEPSRAVFLSYASEDAPAAQRIADALRSAGIEVWFDREELRGGDVWDRRIREQIHDCRLFIPIVSASTEARVEGYFRREWKLAVDRTHDLSERVAFLVPVAIDSTPELRADVPDAFRHVQWTRLPGGEASAAFVDLVRRLLSPPQPDTGAKTDASGGPIEQILPAPVQSVRDHEGAPGGSTTAARFGSISVPSLPRSKSPLRWWTRAVAIALAVAAAGLAYVVTKQLWLSQQIAPEQTKTAATSVVSDKSVAVLPFTDMSEHHDQEYFADGMAEEILDLLAKIPGLTVIGRTSSFQFKGKSADLRTIGTQLNAGHVLEGSVRKSSDEVRITAQLINTRTGTHEWSETYDRQSGDVLKLQDAIAVAVARELQLAVAPGFLDSRSTLKNADAYDLMLRGRHAADRWDREGLDEAVALFKQALDRDPTSADAAAELAVTYEWQGEEGYLTPVAAFEQARRAAAIALKLDPKNARAHFVVGLVHLNYDWDWAAAEQEFQQVAAVAPGGADAFDGEGLLSRALGRWDEALRQFKTALAQDPLRPTSFYELAEIQMRRGYLAEAEAAMRRGLDIRPTYDWGHWLLGLVLLARGERDGALLEMQRVNADDGQQSGLAIVYYALHRKADSDASLARLLKEHAAESPYLIANVYAFRGQSAEAMRWLERAYAQKDSGLVYVKAELPLRSLQEDTRFKAFLRKMNLPE